MAVIKVKLKFYKIINFGKDSFHLQKSKMRVNLIIIKIAKKVLTN
jgi:hypothetical protein